MDRWPTNTNHCRIQSDRIIINNATATDLPADYQLIGLHLSADTNGHSFPLILQHAVFIHLWKMQIEYCSYCFILEISLIQYDNFDKRCNILTIKPWFRLKMDLPTAPTPLIEFPMILKGGPTDQPTGRGYPTLKLRSATASMKICSS